MPGGNNTSLATSTGFTDGQIGSSHSLIEDGSKHY
jgi:transketolase C-terminal domain/subunit